MIRRTLIPLVILLLAILPAAAQDDSTKRLEDAGRSILSDPRLQGVIRNAKENPAEALKTEGLSVDDAVRDFQSRTSGIKAEDLKAAARKAQADGTIERALNKANEVLREQGPAVAAEIKAKTNPGMPEAAPAATAPEPAAEDAAPSATEDSPPARIVAEPAVPATRPAPGVAGGTPAPVAMPIEVPEEAPAVARRAMEATPATIGSEPGTVVGEGTAEPIVGSGPTAPMIPDSPLLRGDDFPAPKPLAKKYATGPGGVHAAPPKTHLEIKAREAVMDDTSGQLSFLHEVFLDGPDYQLRCDKLVIYIDKSASGEDETGAMRRAVASGGMVEIKRVTVDDKGKPKTQIALGRHADYDAVSGEFVLSGGPPYMQDGDRFVKTTSQDSKIIMRKNGLYEITGSTNRINISIPIEDDKSKGGKKKDDPLGGGLEGSFNRFR